MGLILYINSYETEKIPSTQLDDEDPQSSDRQFLKKKCKKLGKLKKERESVSARLGQHIHQEFAKLHQLEINNNSDKNSFEDEPVSTKQRYEAMGDESEQYDSFGDPNFNRLIETKEATRQLLNHKPEDDTIKIIDYANGVQAHFDQKSWKGFKKRGYITPSLGSARNHFEFKENYEENIEIDEKEEELITYNNQMVEDARAFVFGGKENGKHSRNKQLEYDLPNKILMTQGD